MLESVLIFLFQRVKFVVVVIKLELQRLVLSLQLRQFLVILFLGLTLANGNQILFLLLELIGIAQNQTKRVFAHAPLIHRLLIENHHALLGHPHITNAASHLQIVQSKFESTTLLIAHNSIGGGHRFDIYSTNRRPLVLAVIPIRHPLLHDGLGG